MKSDFWSWLDVDAAINLSGLTPEQLARAFTKSQQQVGHLTSLLNESEVNVDRLTEQLKLLKDELRRNERSETRGELNIEYLKNVILQFLQKRDERPQLVPVLSMLLHFTPEELNELQQLQTVDAPQAERGGGWFPRF
ncbi:uncharacterized protein MONBRDRAFT_33471 [Monosiga brevicollis MX1]|uniref:GRIP domain-containing protein n=1 Tax=Monosiga brevicollis TaxID=81824 RepID=A9V5K1_MONBE|nr:uncharacterized protein MONBRDRAFT_33471 [Monosiga brevicollis MX1]EDQ87133.1 predicted protein [Monosiga brevicollis MX1]|eukprot:XP_001748076.1 hypothetical protein [Monosiga brevicollis MX1]